MKVAIVTAGSAGIGKGIIDILLKNDYYVSVTGRCIDKLNKVFSEYNTNKLLLIKSDLSDSNQCKLVIDKTIEKFGQLNLLVNTAGGGILNQTFENANLQEYESVMNLNVKTVFLLTQYAIPYLTETRGTIINFSSVLAHRPVNGLGIYSAAKAAVEMITKSSALELAPKKIRVLCIAPTAIRTEFHTNAGMTLEQANIYYNNCSKTHPLGRVGDVSDVSEVVLFLADSSKSGFMTGTVIHIDGGRLLTSSNAF
jgi:NAD(P)-dependent dehydrogenase (short-subunit alcohol dehydrogenase family)